MPAADRAARFEAITGLRYIEGADEEGGALLWFTFDGACRDAKFSEGDWSLVVTPEDEPEILIHSVDGPLFAERAGYRYKNFRVTLAAYDLKSAPPRLALRPDSASGFRQALDLSKRLVLDKLHEDFLTNRVTDTLSRLRAAPEAARHVAELLATGTCKGWQPLCRDMHRVRHALRRRIGRATGKDGHPLNADSILNAGQWEAWQGVFFEPLTMIWGPPGTGKTHAAGHILLGYALAAQELRRPLRILVTAATHHAIANVLRKTAELASAYGFTEVGTRHHEGRQGERRRRRASGFGYAHGGGPPVGCRLGRCARLPHCGLDRLEPLQDDERGPRARPSDVRRRARRRGVAASIAGRAHRAG